MGGKAGEDAGHHSKERGPFSKHMEQILYWAQIRTSLLKRVLGICALMGSTSIITIAWTLKSCDRILIQNGLSKRE